MPGRLPVMEGVLLAAPAFPALPWSLFKFARREKIGKKKGKKKKKAREDSSSSVIKIPPPNPSSDAGPSRRPGGDGNGRPGAGGPPRAHRPDATAEGRAHTGAGTILCRGSRARPGTHPSLAARRQRVLPKPACPARWQPGCRGLGGGGGGDGRNSPAGLRCPARLSPEEVWILLGKDGPGAAFPPGWAGSTPRHVSGLPGTRSRRHREGPPSTPHAAGTRQDSGRGVLILPRHSPFPNPFGFCQYFGVFRGISVHPAASSDPPPPNPPHVWGRSDGTRTFSRTSLAP